MSSGLSLFEKEMREHRIVVAGGFILSAVSGLLWYATDSWYLRDISLLTLGTALGATLVYLLARLVGPGRRVFWVLFTIAAGLGYLWALFSYDDISIYQVPGGVIYGAFLITTFLSLRLAMLDFSDE